jgi:hypothetical protein
MSRHSRFAQDVLSHFALREAVAGSPLDVDGFRRLSAARSAMTEPQLDAALAELVADGSIMRTGDGYYHTHKGFDHIYGRQETVQERRDELSRREEANPKRLEEN